MPCLGQRPDVGRGSEDKDYRDCGATQRCRQYGLADCMHTAESYVRTKSRRRSRGALQLIQLSPSSHGSSRPHLSRRFFKRQERPLIHQCHRSQRFSNHAPIVIAGFLARLPKGHRASYSSALRLNSELHRLSCHAVPVLTVNCASGKGHIGPKASQVTASPLSDTDLIRIHGLGVKW